MGLPGAIPHRRKHYAGGVSAALNSVPKCHRHPSVPRHPSLHNGKQCTVMPMLPRRSVYVHCRAPVLPRCILAYDVQHDHDRCTKDKAPSAMSSFDRGRLSNCVLDIFGDIFAIPFLCTIVPPSILRCIGGVTTAGRPNRACPQPMLTRYRRRWEARARRRNDLRGGSSARLLHRRPDG